MYSGWMSQVVQVEGVVNDTYGLTATETTCLKMQCGA